MTEKPLSVSVIMPAYNEEKVIESVILKNIKTFEELSIEFEILIVNDKSTDRSGEVAEKIARQFSNIDCYSHLENMGIGASFKTGIKYAKKDYVMFAPFDNPLEPEDLKAYIPYLGVCDIVVGVRTERVGYSWLALCASFTYNRILIPIIFNIGISDVNWIQIYRRPLFSENIINFSISRVFFWWKFLFWRSKNG